MTTVEKFRVRVSRHGLLPTIPYCAAHVFREARIHLWRRGLLHSWSEWGEDRILDRLTGHKRAGFYVDIGAHDPVYLSNTNRFYRRGWRGVNVEPDANHYRAFVAQRPRDINVNAGVSDERGELTLYEIPKGATTFCQSSVQHWNQVETDVGTEQYRVTGTQTVPVITLRDLWAQHIGEQLVDFCSIDVEGFEFKVLGGNDWDHCRPRVFCIETVFHEPGSVTRFMEDLGYEKVAETSHDNLVKNGVPMNEFYRDSGPIR